MASKSSADQPRASAASVSSCSQPPTRIGTSVLDFGTGMWAAIGALGGLVQCHATGRGCLVDASLFETAPGWLTGHLAG